MLTRPLRCEEPDITPTLSTLRDYCIGKEHFDALLDMTAFKSKAAWSGDPMKDVATKVRRCGCKASYHGHAMVQGHHHQFIVIVIVTIIVIVAVIAIINRRSEINPIPPTVKVKRNIIHGVER